MAKWGLFQDNIQVPQQTFEGDMLKISHENIVYIQNEGSRTNPVIAVVRLREGQGV